jgi:uncharacterized protein YecT (DUF1311 family)
LNVPDHNLPSRHRAVRRAAAAALLVGTLCSAPPSAGQEGDLDCDNAFTTVEMVNCIGRDIEAAEAALRDALAAHRELLDDQGLALLETSQRAWEGYRDAECDRARDVVRGGTMGPLIAGACIVDMTHARTREISGRVFVGDTPETVFWSDAPPLVDEFLCAGYVEARVGLVSRFDPAAAGAPLAVRVQVGDTAIDFPVGTETQDSVCSADVALGVVSTASCPALRLDDGACDAIVIGWDPESQQLRWTRQ